MMRNFEVSSDSTCELYADEIKKLEVFVSPLTFTIGEDGNLGEYLDNFQKHQFLTCNHISTYLPKWQKRGLKMPFIFRKAGD